MTISVVAVVGGEVAGVDVGADVVAVVELVVEELDVVVVVGV